jgi:hypothetical protein
MSKADRNDMTELSEEKMDLSEISSGSEKETITLGNIADGVGSVGTAADGV